MTDLKLRILQNMQRCIKGLEDVKAALKVAENDPLLEVKITATHVGNAYRSFDDMPAHLPVNTYDPFREAFVEFIDAQLTQLQAEFDKA